MLEYIDNQRERLKNIASSTDIKYFNSILIGKRSYTSLIKKLNHFFQILTQDLQLPDYSKEINIEEESEIPIEPIKFNGTGECLGLLFYLMFSVKFFGSTANLMESHKLAPWTLLKIFSTCY